MSSQIEVHRVVDPGEGGAPKTVEYRGTTYGRIKTFGNTFGDALDARDRMNKVRADGGKAIVVRFDPPAAPPMLSGPTDDVRYGVYVWPF